MPDDIETTSEETPSSSDSADETATNASPVDDASSPAESGAEEEPVEETPEQTAEREKKERTDARIKLAETAEKKAELARKKRLADRELSDREERISAREQQAHQTFQQAQQLLQQLQAQAEAVRKGGYDGLKALGVDYGDWTKQTLENTGPEALARQAQERVDRLEAEIRKRDQETAQQRAIEAAAHARKRFESFVDESAEDFPDTALLTPRVLHILAGEAATEYQRETGHAPSFSALLPRLDKKAKEFHDEQKTRSAKRARPGDKPSDGATNTQATLNGHHASKPANRTLTPAAAATKASAPRPPTPEEEDEWALNELRQAMKADSAPAR